LLTVSLIALGLLAYTYVGYPLLILALGRLWPGTVRADDRYLPTVSVCIPAYNAEEWLERKMESLRGLDYPPERLEFLLYSDASTDRTDELAQALAAGDERVKVHRSPERRGKPSALNRMRELASGEVLLLTDVRQPLEPGALRALVRLLADPEIGCVSGNLLLRDEAGVGVYWRYENLIRESEARFRSMVGATGPVYVVRRDDLAPVPPNVILDDMMVPMRLRLAGRRNVFAREAIAWEEAFADGREFGRKARTLAGNFQLFALLPALLLPHGSWFEVFSHKILRLLCPWLLALLLVSSTGAALEPHSLAVALGLRALVAAQLVGYLCALAGARAGRIGVVARTFVVLNWAAVVGLWRFLRDSQRVTW
jgi:cellulose synthase/poly-beta-1,6-N-acetylglucosamine synthase-like glycosyltransferase